MAFRGFATEKEANDALEQLSLNINEYKNAKTAEQYYEEMMAD